MKTTRYTCLCILFPLILSVPVNSMGQDTMTAQKVIRRFIEVSGGEKFLGSLKATGGTAKGIVFGDSTTITIIKAGSTKMYMRYDMANNGIIESVYNNGKLKVTKDGKAMPITDSSGFEDLQLNSFTLADMGYEKLGYKLELLPSEEDSTYKIRVVSPKGRTSVKYYSKSTGYLTKIIYPEGDTGYFFDYATKDGFTISKRETVITEKGKRDDVFITTFTTNPKYDPKIFDF